MLDIDIHNKISSFPTFQTTFINDLKTGPDGDHTQSDGSGKYAYAEASQTGTTAELISPCIDVPLGLVNPSIGFWYHRYGSQMGELHIDLYDGANWINDVTPAIVGEQQNAIDDPYEEKTFSVAAYEGTAVKIRFRAIKGSGFRGDIAIDDFELFDATAPAPVELTSFTGKAIDQQHLLNWVTSSEQNSELFSLEHSIDGERFIEIGKVTAQGTSFDQQEYQYTHATPQIGINYYRLKIIDWDGSFDYSNIIQLEMKREGNGLSVYPNPGKGRYQLEMKTNLNEVNFQVFNAVGQAVQQGQWNPQEAILSLDLSNFPNGIYLIQVKDNGRMIDLQRIIKE